MPSRTSPSPSPPPDAPESSTLEPGPRATALKKIYTSALQSTLKSNSYPNFASCFPTPAKYCPTALEGVWRQLNARLEEECQKDFEKILQERKTIQGLNDLDSLSAQARERRDRGVEGEEPLALHTLTAQQLSDARMHGFLVKSKTELEVKLSATQHDNRAIMENIRVQREEIQRLVAGIEGLVGDINGAVDALEGLNGEEMRRAIWDTDQDIATAK